MTAYAQPNTAAYQQQAILTATPGRLVVMLYDGALRFLFQAAAAMREGSPQADEKIHRAEAIVNELLVRSTCRRARSRSSCRRSTSSATG